MLRWLLTRARPEPWPGAFTPPRLDLIAEEARAERDAAEAEADRLRDQLCACGTEHFCAAEVDDLLATWKQHARAAEDEARYLRDVLDALRGSLLVTCPRGPEHPRCAELARAQDELIARLQRANEDRDAVGLAALRGRPVHLPPADSRPSTVFVGSQGAPADLAAARTITEGTPDA